MFLARHLEDLTVNTPPEGYSSGATATTSSAMYPYLPHLSHLTMDELKGQSEPSTPVLKTVKPPMHRNLSDLGPRFKKRVTYRCWSTINDSIERPASVSSDEAMPLTPILKKTNRAYKHHNVRTQSYCGGSSHYNTYVTNSSHNICDVILLITS